MSHLFIFHTKKYTYKMMNQCPALYDTNYELCVCEPDNSFSNV